MVSRPALRPPPVLVDAARAAPAGAHERNSHLRCRETVSNSESALRSLTPKAAKIYSRLSACSAGNLRSALRPSGFILHPSSFSPPPSVASADVFGQQPSPIAQKLFQFAHPQVAGIFCFELAEGGGDQFIGGDASFHRRSGLRR